MNRISLFLLALLTSYAPNTNAQEVRAGGTAFVGRTKASPGCPIVNIHILRNGEFLSGVVFYDGGKGYSEIQGTVLGNDIEYHQTTIHGDGPTGVVHGTILPEGKMVLKVDNTSCSYQTTLPMLNDYSNG